MPTPLGPEMTTGRLSEGAPERAVEGGIRGILSLGVLVEESRAEAAVVRRLTRLLRLVMPKVLVVVRDLGLANTRWEHRAAGSNM